MNTESTSSNSIYVNSLTELKLMMAALEAKNQTLQKAMENLELKAEIRALKENAEQKANYQALETKFAQMISTQKEEHQQELSQIKDEFGKQMAQLEAKNRMLEKKLTSIVEVQTTKNGALGAKMDQLQDEFSKMLTQQQQNQMMKQFQEGMSVVLAPFHFLEKKLKEAEQGTQTGKNELELEEDIQQEMEKFREEVDKNGQQAIGSNLNTSKILANPKGLVWDRAKTDASVNISECGLKATNIRYEFGFAIATEGYAISGEHCRKDFQFPGTIVYYYEITSDCIWHKMGFTDGSKPHFPVGGSPNSYGIAHDALRLSGMKQDLDWPKEIIDGENVIGSGLLINSKNELAVFFTLNGILRIKQTPINPTVDRLYPTINIYYGIPKGGCTVEANFGDNLVANPFKFDTDKWPGLVFE